MYHPLVQCITRFPDIDIFCAFLAKDRIDNVCGLATNVVFYVIMFTAVVFELVRRHDVRADCTVFPTWLTLAWFRKEQIIVFFANHNVL